MLLLIQEAIVIQSMQINLNTSNVTVNPAVKKEPTAYELYLNTSNVTVNPITLSHALYSHLYLNTSNVTVNLTCHVSYILR